MFYGSWERTCVLLLLGGMLCKGQFYPVGWSSVWVLFMSRSVSCWEKDTQVSKCNFGSNLPFLSHCKLLLPRLWIAVRYEHIYGLSFWCNSLFIIASCLSPTQQFSLIWHLSYLAITSVLFLINICKIDLFYLPFSG